MNKYGEYLQKLQETGNLRTIPGVGPTVVTDYSTNDYMGLAADSQLQEKFFADPVSATVPMSSTAARLLAPRQIEYTNLEVFLTLLYKSRRGTDTQALLFNSGYHANIGIIPAVADKNTLIVADKLVHASIIDGILLSGAPFQRFRHNDFNHLEEILKKEAGNHEQVLVVVESIYSMDGDSADIERLLELKRLYPNVLLYVDEAHAFGVVGPRGLGMVAGSSAPAEVDFIIGTFGKAAASMGAFAITGLWMHDYLVNTCRSFIFSTALPPMSVAWTRFTVGQLVQKDNRRQHLAELGLQLHQVLGKYSDFPGQPSHIQPLIIGDAQKAVDLSRRLLDRYGIRAMAIRRPTVPPGTERLRFSLTANMLPRDIETLDKALAELMHA